MNQMVYELGEIVAVKLIRGKRKMENTRKKLSELLAIFKKKMVRYT